MSSLLFRSRCLHFWYWRDHWGAIWRYKWALKFSTCLDGRSSPFATVLLILEDNKNLSWWIRYYFEVKTDVPHERTKETNWIYMRKYTYLVYLWGWKGLRGVLGLLWPGPSVWKFKNSDFEILPGDGKARYSFQLWMEEQNWTSPISVQAEETCWLVRPCQYQNIFFLHISSWQSLFHYFLGFQLKESFLSAS